MIIINKIKITKSERVILVFVILLGVFTLGSLLIIKDKCLFVKNYDPIDIQFKNRENVAVLNANCGNVIIQEYSFFYTNIFFLTDIYHKITIEISISN